MSERPARVYRHWPFLASTVFLLLLEVDFVVMLVSWVVRAPSYESVVESILALVPLLAFGTFLVLVWRIRTVVDDTGVSQYWIRRSYRVPRAEITAVETENGLGRWFLRVYCAVSARQKSSRVFAPGLGRRVFRRGR